MKKNLLLVGALVSAFLLASCSGGDKSKAPVVSTADIENAAEVIKYYNTSLGVLKDMVKEKDVNAVLDYMEQKGKTPALSAIVPPAVVSKDSLQKALTGIEEVKKDFWTNVRIPGDVNELNVELEKALRLIDFIEVGMLMARDGLNREESCGGHFRTEYQTPEGEALRDDKNFSYVACWKYTGENSEPELIKEDLNYQFVKVQTRNYKS